LGFDKDLSQFKSSLHGEIFKSDESLSRHISEAFHGLTP
jgi:hypothetical protein